MNEPLTLLKSPRDERDWHYGRIVCAGGELPKRVSLRRAAARFADRARAAFVTALQELR